MGDLCPIQPLSDFLASPNLQPSLSVRERLGFGSICLPQGACVLPGTVLGEGTSARLRGSPPNTARSHTFCVFPDRPAHLGHAISGVLFQGGQPQGKQRALRTQIQMCTCHMPWTHQAQHSGLSTSLASQTRLCKHLWECGQALVVVII